MNSISRPFNVLVLPFLLLSVASMASYSDARRNDKKETERNRLVAAAREIMAAARYCALITVDASGRAQARTMDPFSPDENLVVWLGTNSKSRKVAEIRHNPRVALYYFDSASQGYVAISGTARIVNEPKEKARHWKEEWKAFYPDRDKSYLLIAVTPEKLEVVCEKKGITGDPHTWTPPTVSFQRGKE